MRTRQSGTLHLRLAISALVTLMVMPVTARSECDNDNFDSTFALIQDAIFERHNCTNALCHGFSPGSGGLDLRPDVAYDNLVDVAAQSLPAQKWTRVLPGQASASLLWVNLAAKTLPDAQHAPLRAMPLDPYPALSLDEIEAMRLWIKAGAPRTGVVQDTADLLDACLPPPKPIEISPLPPPAPGAGVQIVMPRWYLDANSEREVCFASYYDVTDQVPPNLRTADGKFRYKFHQTRQDPLSHHMIPVLYEGTADPHSPLWPGFFCRGGAYDGESCDPMMIGDCGADAQCATPADSSVACIGYGPGDGGFGLSAAGISITQQTAEEFFYADGVYGELPLKGMILWNSHAFNLTDSAGRLEAWLNFEFAQPQEQVTPAQDIYDVTAVMATNAPAFGTDEPCAIALLPQHAHVFDLSSHTHKRGKRFRAFLGAFQCQGGPASGAACSPLGYDFVSRDTCQGAPCVAMMHPRTGDCDLNQRVTIDELVTSVIIALDKAPLSECDDIDLDENNRVQMNELVTAVGASLHGVPPATQRDPEESLIYVNLIYNDPLVLRMDDDPLIFNSPIADQRALTYCSLYDNGYTNPEEVKRRSTSPEPPNNFFLGGPCKIPTGCTQGKVTADCSGGPLEERNRSCDSSDGAGDGLCDACPLVGGVTTEDEMFVLLGHYFIR